MWADQIVKVCFIFHKALVVNHQQCIMKLQSLIKYSCIELYFKGNKLMFYHLKARHVNTRTYIRKHRCKQKKTRSSYKSYQKRLIGL